MWYSPVVGTEDRLDCKLHTDSTYGGRQYLAVWVGGSALFTVAVLMER